MSQARITREFPALITLLLDRSSSMQERIIFEERPCTKATALAQIINSTINELLLRCRRDGSVADYFRFVALGYSGDGVEYLLGSADSFALPSVMWSKDVPMRTLTREIPHPDGHPNIVSRKLRYWIEPKSTGDTPMLAALEATAEITERWCEDANNILSHPPLIINITDGEATDGSAPELLSMAERIKATGTQHGQTTLMNINIRGTSNKPVIFPCSRSELPLTAHADLLYEMSSEMPESCNKMIREINPASPPFRGTGINASPSQLAMMLDIGSSSLSTLF